MATTIVTKFGVSPATPPLPSELAVGELACNHADATLYTKKADGTVIQLIGASGDPGVLPLGADGDMLYHNGSEWAVAPDLQFADNPDKPGQRELQLLNSRQFSQYTSADDSVRAFEIIGDSNTDNGIRCTQSGGIFGIQLSTDTSNNVSELIMQKPGTQTQGIRLYSGGNDASTLEIDGPVLSTGGTSFFAGITMDGTNAGINMQNLHRVFNHPDPSTADGTNVANARWVNNNYVSKTASQTVSGTKTWSGEQFHSTNIRLTNGSIVMSNGSVQLVTTTGSNTAQRKDYIDAGDSDIRLKKNITELGPALEAVSMLNPFIYDWDGAGTKGVIRKRAYHHTRYGLSAQEVEQLFPHAVHHLASDRDDDGGSISGQFYKGMMYEELVPVLVKAIQELNDKVEALSQ